MSNAPRGGGSGASKGFVLAAFLVGGCAGTPAPDWQFNAKSALDRAQAAQLTGNARVEAAELEHARREIGRTGRIDLLARVELAHCAARVASLSFETCAAFEPLRAHAPSAERAYADYLYARLEVKDIALLPPAHRSVASSTTATSALPATLQSIEDPLSRLVAAAVLLRSGRADPAVVAMAVDTASAQGWRRPLLAWLKLQLELAEKAGASSEADRLRRRIALVQGEFAAAPQGR